MSDRKIIKSKKPKRTEIADLGEFALIDRLVKPFKSIHKSTVKGIGDDAAIIENKGKLTVVSTDLLIEGIHYDLVYTPLKHLGYKAIIANISDIYAMNAIAEHVTFSIAISNRFSVEALDEIYEGVRIACERYKVDLIGGDTSSMMEGSLISVTAIGTVKAKDLVMRNGAKVGDLICVTGDIGAAYIGLQLLEREKDVYLENPKIQPDLEGQDYIVGKLLKPEARRDVIKELADAKVIPTSMIDLSDGLSSDLRHICNQSGVGAKIMEEKLPIADETITMGIKFNIDGTTCALNGGEDYELLFTINPKDLEKLADSKNITMIGQVVGKKTGMKLVTNAGKEHVMKAQGWKAFDDKD